MKTDNLEKARRKCAENEGNFQLTVVFKCHCNIWRPSNRPLMEGDRFNRLLIKPSFCLSTEEISAGLFTFGFFSLGRDLGHYCHYSPPTLGSTCLVDINSMPRQIYFLLWEDVKPTEKVGEIIILKIRVEIVISLKFIFCTLNVSVSLSL